MQHESLYGLEPEEQQGAAVSEYTAEQTGAYIRACLALGFFNPDLSQPIAVDMAECFVAADAGDERAKQYVVKYTRELLK